METDKTRVWLRRVSLAAGVAFTAHAEYDLARTLGADPWIAAMLPVAVDAYVIAALRWFRAFDIFLSLSLMGAAQIAAHLLDARVMTVNIPMVVVVSLLVPVSIWRTHALARIEQGVPEPDSTSVELPSEADQTVTAVTVERPSTMMETPPVPEVYPVLGVRVPAVPEAVPAGVRMLPIVARPEADVDVIHVGPVAAAEYPRTRSEVHAEYVPDPVPEGVPEDDDEEPVADPDPLILDIPISFENLLRQGGTPSVRSLRSTYSIGQARAQRLRDRFDGSRS